MPRGPVTIVPRPFICPDPRVMARLSLLETLSPSGRAEPTTAFQPCRGAPHRVGAPQILLDT